MRRGEVWWADLGEPAGSAPGYRHPALVVSTDLYNESRIGTVVVVMLTSNLRLAAAPGNLLVSARDTGLPKDSVVNVSQILTVDKAALVSRVGHLSGERLRAVEEGLRAVLGV